MEILIEGIVLRPWSIVDAAKLALIADNKNIADNLRDAFPFPYYFSDAREWLNSILPENAPPKFFAITLDKRLVGSIGIVSKTDIYRKNFEIGYFIDEEYWGRGIVTLHPALAPCTLHLAPCNQHPATILPSNNEPIIIFRINYSIDNNRFIN